MHRTTIMADEGTLDRLRDLARDRNVSLATVIRDALEDKARSYRPRPASIGTGRSSPSRTAATRGSYRQPPRPWR